MIRTISNKFPGAIKKDVVCAVDEEIGPVTDLLFDDRAWTVRYLTVKVAGGLASEETIISPVSVSRIDRERSSLYIDLDKERAQQAPYLQANLPVSSQQETAYYDYLEVDPYWMEDQTAAAPVPPTAGASQLANSSAGTAEYAHNVPEGDPHLRSMQEVEGYRIHTTDDSFGHVEDFLLDDEGWKLRYIVVDTRNWLPAKMVLVPLDFISEVRWSDQIIGVDLTSEKIKDAPAWYPAFPLAHDYEARLQEYYGLSSHQVEDQ